MKIKIFIFGILFLLSVIPVFINRTVSGSVKTKSELFKPELIRFNSSRKVINGIDSLYQIKSQTHTFDTSLYVQTASDFVKNRFYHGLATYSITDNWIAYLSGKFVWQHFMAIVRPDDILKHQEGLCSQQTIVFLDILKRKGINFRTVGLGFKEGPGHFLSEVSYNGSWHLHDVTIEPKWENVANHHESLNYYLQNTDSLFLAYQDRLDRPVFDKILEKVEYGDINEFPAKSMLLFHQITYMLTYFFPILFLVMLIKLSFFKPKSIV